MTPEHPRRLSLLLLNRPLLSVRLSGCPWSVAPSGLQPGAPGDADPLYHPMPRLGRQLHSNAISSPPLLACSLVLKAMQDPEYCRFLDDAIYQERRRGFPQGIRCAAVAAAWHACTWTLAEAPGAAAPRLSTGHAA